MGYRLGQRNSPPLDLPPARRDHDATAVRIGGTFTTIGGTRRQHTLAWKRTWSLDFAIISDAEYASLAAWLDPQVHGHGPFELWEDDAQFPALVNITALTRTKVITGYVRSTMTLDEV